MRRLCILFIIVFAVAVVAFGYRWHRSRQSFKVDAQSLDSAVAALQMQDFDRAIALFEVREQSNTQQDTLTSQWMQVALTAYAAEDRTQDLAHMYDCYPESFNTQESAALMLLPILQWLNYSDAFATLRGKWSGREEQKTRWFFLDTDTWVQRGDYAKAIDLLNSQQLDGATDARRLLRLSLLEPRPSKSAQYLDAAVQVSRRDADVRAERARRFFAAQQWAEAIYEYRMAVESDPSNPDRRLALADAYLALGDYISVVDVLADATKCTPDATVWFEAFFWSRMVRNVPLANPPYEPHDPMSPLVDYLRALPQDRFWDATRFASVPNADHLLNTLQPLFWLRLCETLRVGDNAGALKLLANNPFAATCYSPGLATALYDFLTIQSLGALPETLGLAALKAPANVLDSQPVPLFAGLAQSLQAAQQAQTKSPAPSVQSYLPQELSVLMSTPQAIPVAMLLAAQFTQAAYGIAPNFKAPAQASDGFILAYTQMLQSVEGPQAALSWLPADRNSPSMTLLRAELQFTDDDLRPRASKALEPLASEDSLAGAQAARMLIVYAISKERFSEANVILNQNPYLMRQSLGIELAAQIAIAQGQLVEAERLLVPIADGSSFATEFLAARAIACGDWPTAQRYMIGIVEA